MHDDDSLYIILQAIKANLPGVPDETWTLLERNLRDDLGGRDHFIAKRAKRTHLDRLEAAMQADQNATNSTLAQRLGVSISRVQQLKRLRR
jgi:phage gp16-like protein